MSDFVLDSSAALAWCFEDEVDDHSDALLDRFTEAAVLVPQHWRLELANALWAGARRGRLNDDSIRDFIQLIESRSVEVDGETAAQALGPTRHLAVARNLAVYDAAYLELARRAHLPLATRDEAMIRAAVAEGVPVIRG